MSVTTRHLHTTLHAAQRRTPNHPTCHHQEPSLNAAYTSLARSKPCDLTVSCPSRSVSLACRARGLPITPTTPNTDLSNASQITNISSENPHTLPPAPCSGPLHPLPDCLDALDRSALEHVARLLYADSTNSRSATTQVWENTQKTDAAIEEVEQRTDLAIASLQSHALEKEAQLQAKWAEVESLRSRLADVSDLLSAIFPDLGPCPDQGEQRRADGDDDVELTSTSPMTIRC